MSEWREERVVLKKSDKFYGSLKSPGIKGRRERRERERERERERVINNAFSFTLDLSHVI